MKRSALIAALLLLGSVPTPTHAGIADSPLPVLVAGKTTFHLYSVPGIIHVPGLRTFFACTSTDTANMQVGIELFPRPGGAPSNLPAATSLTLAPGATVIFGTGAAIWVSIDSSLGGPGGSVGSARILATSRKLACTAFVADDANAPPLTTWQLTIIKGTSQQGE